MIFGIIISVITLLYTHMLSSKSKSGLYVGILCQVLWTIYILFDIKEYGLLVLNVGLYTVLLNGIKNWENN